MRSHTQDFKNQLKSLGRQIEVAIIYNGLNISNQVFSASCHYEGNLLKSVMKQLDIETSVDIPINAVITCRIGVHSQGMARMMDFGNYVVYKSEKLEDSNHYQITCYDKMIYAMKQNEDLNITYPITIKNYITALCTKIGLTVNSSNLLFLTNGSREIQEELYLGLDYTYRDILDEIAEATGKIIYINNDDKLSFKSISSASASDTINEEFLKDVNVQFGEIYGPINSVVLARSGESDVVYDRDETSVAQNGLCEIKIVDNQILNGNDRSDYLPGILGSVNGITYSINDFNTVGILYYELGDKFNVQIGNTTYPCLMLNDDITVSTGLTESIYTKMPEQSETDYKKAGKDDRQISLIVDKQNKKIQAVADNSATKAELQLTADELRSTISASIGTTNTINNSDFSAIDNNGDYNYLHWTLADTGDYEVQSIDGKTWLDIFKDTLGTFYLEQEFRNMDKNENYVFSFKLKNNAIAQGDERNEYISLVLYFYDSSNNVIDTITHQFTIQDILTEQEFEYTFTTPNQTIAYAKLRLQFSNYYDSGNVNSVTFSAKITNLQLELGTVKTDWMPSQSDFYEKVQQYSQIVQTIDEISLEVSTKVGEDEIISKINQSAEAVEIDANKISLNGKQINLTSDTISIVSTNFSVDANGNMNCVNGNFSGNINIGGDQSNPEFICEDSDCKIEMFPGSIFIFNDIWEGDIYIEKGRIALADRSGNETRIYSDGISSEPIYNNTLSGSANLRINSYGNIGRATGSSKRWKTDITENIDESLNPEKLYDLKIKQFKFKDDYLDKKDKRYGQNIIGFIAEDVKDIYEIATEYDEDGNVEMWNSDVMIPAMLKLIQEQHNDIETMKKEIETLKNK